MREVRQRAGLSRADLAVMAEISPETVRNAETGKRVPSARVAASIARALGVEVGDLAPASGEITLKQLRQYTGLTQRQTAEVIGVSAGMVSKVEAGLYGVRDPQKWATAYQVSRAVWTAAWRAGRTSRRQALATRGRRAKA
uniref:helix-turn-helix domain-containing protein n=1 Tax=unclassified Streptomyces TaxID=2593676 RepID=UPI003F49B1A4